MEGYFNEISEEKERFNFSELETINYYRSIKNELCIICYIIIEDKIKYLSERRNSSRPSNAIEKYLETEPMFNLKSIICTSCINKLSNTSTLTTEDEYENLVPEFPSYPEETEKLPSLKNNENSSLTENKVSYNLKISSSGTEIKGQCVSLVDDIASIQHVKPTWVCNDCEEWFSTWEALFNHMESSDHMNIGINYSQFQPIVPPIPIIVSNIPSTETYECKNGDLNLYNTHDFKNHNFEQINSQISSTNTEQGNDNANFNPVILNKKKEIVSQSENNRVHKIDHISETKQRTGNNIKNHDHNNLFILTETTNSCNLEFDKDFISVQKLGTCNGNDAPSTSPLERGKHSVKPYCCHLCDKGFIRKILLSNHIKSHNLNTTTAFHKGIRGSNQLSGIGEKQKKECNICNKTFNSKQALTRHFAVHEKYYPVSCFKCLTCQEVFPFEKYIIDHVSDGCKSEVFNVCGNNIGEYEEIKIYRFLVCEYCIRGFETVDELNNHRKTHHGQLLFFCTSCQKKFKTYWKLRCHQRSHNYSEEYKQFLELRRSFICPFCSNGASSYCTFKQHLSKHQEKINSSAYKTLKSHQSKKNIFNCVQEIKTRKTSRNTTKGAKERNSNKIVLNIISCDSKQDEETKECFVDDEEERKKLNLQQLIAIYPPNYLQDKNNISQNKEFSNQVTVTNEVSQLNNQTKKHFVDHEEDTLSGYLSNKQQIKTTYRSNHSHDEINNNQSNKHFNQLLKCTESIQDYEREQLSPICSMKLLESSNLLKDNPRKKLHDCKFCSKRFKKVGNLVRHMKCAHT